MVSSCSVYGFRGWYPEKSTPVNSFTAYVKVNAVVEKNKFPLNYKDVGSIIQCLQQYWATPEDLDFTLLLT